MQLFGGYAMSYAHSSYFDDVYDQVLHDGFIVGAAVGTDVGHGVRLEQEFSYVEDENDATAYNKSREEDCYQDYSGHTSSFYLLGNLSKEFELGFLRPYLGGGLIKNDGSYDEGDYGWDDLGFGPAAQVGGGVRVGLGERLAIDAGYRLKAIVDAVFDSSGVNGNGGSANTVYTQSFQIGASFALRGSAMPEDQVGSNLYVSLFGGGVLPANASWNDGEVYGVDGKAGYSAGGAVGTELREGLRGEVEVSYLDYGLDSYSPSAGDEGPASGNLQAGFLLANLWKDIDLGLVRPYVGGDLGFALARVDGGDFGGRKINDEQALSLAGQFGFGVRANISDHLLLDVGYRFKSLLEGMIPTDLYWAFDTGFENAELTSHQHVLQAGLTYDFGDSLSVQPTADVPGSSDHYVSLFGGAAFPASAHAASDSLNYIATFKTGFTLGAAVGTSLGDSLRGDVELSYLASGVRDVTRGGEDSENAGGDLGGAFLLANLWYDVKAPGVTRLGPTMAWQMALQATSPMSARSG